MNRRQFLTRAGGAGAAVGLGAGFWERALAQTAQPGDSPYGPLLAPDGNGLRLPAGFTSRVIAASMTPVAGTSYLWHPFPDGGACLPAPGGGWYYISNSENPPPVDVPNVSGLLNTLMLAFPDLPTSGGVSVIRFNGDTDATIADAYSILDGSQSNCAGGLTPWGTWLSCEEWEDDGDAGYAAGQVWECDPSGALGPISRPSLGRFKHEMVAVDPVRKHLYLSEDQPDGLFYQYTPPAGVWGSGEALVGGVLRAMAVDGNDQVEWIDVAAGVDPTAPSAPLRTAYAGAKTFDGGEGVVYDDGRIYLTTKGDDRVWVHDIDRQTMRVLYDGLSFPAPVLDGVDNIIVSAAHDIYVAEDGGNLEVCVITPDLVVAPVVRMEGLQHGVEGGPLPTISEVTGLALSPDGNRLYFNSERGNGVVPVGPGPGILYEVRGPFRGGSLAAGPSTPPIAPPPPAAPPGPGSGTGSGTAATGLDTATQLKAAGLIAVVGGALWRLRERVQRAQ